LFIRSGNEGPMFMVETAKPISTMPTLPDSAFLLTICRHPAAASSLSPQKMCISRVAFELSPIPCNDLYLRVHLACGLRGSMNRMFHR